VLRSGAVSVLARAIDALDAWQPEYSKQHAFPTGLGVMEATMNIGSVESGWPFKPTYRPPIANVYLTLRVTPAMAPSEPLDELRALLDELGPKVGFDYELETYGTNVPSTITAADHPLVRTAIGARERVLGPLPNDTPSRYMSRWNDSNIFRQHGIPTVILGPSTGETVERTPKTYDLGQRVSVAQLTAAVSIYGEIARGLQ
jgi:acetylornithine deacetylase/succinyl-diaminopimelate desuccinylase-like protein